MPYPRHLLIVATQGPGALPHLPKLEAAARDLCEALTDEAIGAWSPGLPDGRSLLVGSLAKGDVTACVGQAISYAAEQGAVLTMVFMGHGVLGTDAGPLYLMCAESVEGHFHTAVNITDLYVEAANCAGVRGVIGLVDTCSAGGAAMDLGRLAVGTQRGTTRIALLMAAKAVEEAYDFDFSNALVRLSRTGIPGSTPRLSIESLAMPVKNQLSGHGAVEAKYDGALAGAAPLWLVINRAHGSIRPKGSLSRHSAALLNDAIAQVDPSRPEPARWDRDALRELDQDQGGKPLTPERGRVLELARDLSDALVTADFVRVWLGGVMTSASLRNAVARLHLMPGSSLSRMPDSTRDDVQSVIEHFAVQRPASAAAPRSVSLAQLVVTLAVTAGKDLAAPELGQWAESIDAQIAVNDAVQQMRQVQAAKRLRLAISLHASPTGEWPESLEAWLIDGCESVAHDVFECPASQRGVEGALIQAVTWGSDVAERLAPRGDVEAELLRVDVAAPSALLAQWHPEEVVMGPRLGVDYEVRIHWSVRINPPADLEWINRRAAKKWHRMEQRNGASPVTWLESDTTTDVAFLRDNLRNDVYEYAIALDHQPQSDGDLLALLMAYTPVLLWPSEAAGFATTHRCCVTDRWDELPTGLLAERRELWRGKPADPIAALYAVWDDLEWIKLCCTTLRPARR